MRSVEADHELAEILLESSIVGVKVAKEDGRITTLVPSLSLLLDTKKAMLLAPR